jgi:hypothetical protein
VIPKPKVLRAVKIPAEMIESMQLVQDIIIRGDEVTTAPTDDCIQEGCLCGGLMDDGSGRFYFSVHFSDNSPYVWDIAVSAEEIAGIASGGCDEISLWCCADQKCGFKTYIPDITCHWCDHGGDRTPED